MIQKILYQELSSADMKKSHNQNQTHSGRWIRLYTQNYLLQLRHKQAICLYIFIYYDGPYRKFNILTFTKIAANFMLLYLRNVDKLFHRLSKVNTSKNILKHSSKVMEPAIAALDQCVIMRTDYKKIISYNYIHSITPAILFFYKLQIIQRILLKY